MKTLLLLCALCTFAQAATTVQLSLNRNLELNTTSPAGNVPWVVVSLTEVAKNEVKVDVSLNLTGGEHITNLGLNFPENLDFAKISISGVAGTGFTLPTVSVMHNVLASGLGSKFDLNLFFSDSSSSKKQFGGKETLSFVAAYSGDIGSLSPATMNILDATSQSYAMARVEYINDCGKGAWVTTTTGGEVIPETSGAVLSAVSLALLLGRRKR